MDSLLTLIDRWAGLDSTVGREADSIDARHALELRILELTSYLEGMNMAGVQLGRPLLLLRGDQPS